MITCLYMHHAVHFVDIYHKTSRTGGGGGGENDAELTCELLDFPFCRADFNNNKKNIAIVYHPHRYNYTT